jgi:hypothetical protein
VEVSPAAGEENRIVVAVRGGEPDRFFLRNWRGLHPFRLFIKKREQVYKYK